MATDILDPQYTPLVPTLSWGNQVIVSLGLTTRTYGFVCEICLDSFSTGDQCARSSCCHLRTHSECLSTWLRSSACNTWIFRGSSDRIAERRTTCPKCRTEIFVTSLEGIMRLRKHEIARKVIDQANVTKPALAFQEEMNCYFRRSVMQSEISRQFASLAESGSERSKWWCWNGWRQTKKEKQDMKDFSWLSAEHKKVGTMYLGYSRDWVALSETVPPEPR